MITHAVEAYLSRYYNTARTRARAERAVVTIFSHLERAYRDGASLPDRAAMLQASFDAGAAFTRASVGNVPEAQPPDAERQPAEYP
ncbi:iron-containing alcohol dehydrogenase [Flintibacter faecis]|nr:iron-containing alcohol dehydrogenase [Flintibacter faecis]